MPHLLEPDAPLELWLRDRDLPAWRAKAIRRWLFASRVESFDEMTDLPKGLRDDLAGEFSLWTTSIARHHQAEDGTEKLLLQLHDNQRIECVMLRDGDRRTVCISSQVGCAMGCVFCASGLDGVIRNLSTGEIIEQLLRLSRLLPPALAEAQRPDGLGISQRRITISTVGLPPAMERLTEENPGYHLAVSLHAADDELRTKLVPVNKSIGLADIMAAADRYWETSGRRLTFEYVLLGGVNDSPDDAAALARLLGGRAALVNVIPYNPVAGLPWKEPTATSRERFLGILRDAGVNVQVRRRKGSRINAACGQLRRLEPILPSHANQLAQEER
jgi:23S rRNA (adenine2503-C2)-methyltransferase